MENHFLWPNKSHAYNEKNTYNSGNFGKKNIPVPQNTALSPGINAIIF